MGGGFAAESNAVVLFNISGSTVDINNNSALLSGGGFYSNNAAVVFDESFNISANVSLGKGGGFYAVNNSLILAYNSSVLSGNRAAGDGGGFYAGSASGVSLGESSFYANSSEGSGGGFASDSAEVLFDHTVTLISNTANVSGGGFSAAAGSEITFEKRTSLRGNAAGNGGGFYAAGSKVSFSDSVEFLENASGLNGGGFAASDSAEITFNSDSLFKSNTAEGYGGAVSLIGNAKAILYGNPTGFEDFFTANSAFAGGAIAVENATAELRASGTNFTSNSASQSGGAVYLKGNAGSVLISGNAKFTSNSAVYGGAVYADSSNGLKLQGKNNLFSLNTASESGGAFFTNGSAVMLSGKNTFTANSAVNAGGAAAITNNSNMDLSNSASFTDNSAAYGGALFIESSDVSLTDPYFSGNSASTAGGAIYLQGTQTRIASLTVKSASGATIFSGNTAGGKSNALHIGDYSIAAFNTASGASVEMHDAITSGSTGSRFLFSGSGDFNFYGNASENSADMEFDSFSGAAFNLKNGAVLNAGNLTNNTASTFNMVNSRYDTVNVKNLTDNGTLNMEISAAGQNDKIISSGDVILGNASILNIESGFMSSYFRSRTYRLINYANALTGVFNTVNVNPSAVFSINYGDLIANWITLTLKGTLSTTDLSALSGLSFNQKQTAKTFDALSASSAGDLDGIISVIESSDENGQKKALAQTSGYFLANVIRSAAVDSEVNELYDRIKNHCSSGKESSGFWAQYRTNYAVNSADKNSLNDYSDLASGMMAGYDMYNNGKVLGFYGRYNSHNMKQDPKNKAEMTNAGAGIYGGIVKYGWELKADLSGSYDNYSADRYIPFLGRTANSDFDGFTFGGGAEAALKYKLTYKTEFRPFAAIEAKKTNYNDFSESGAGSINLDVSQGGYLRAAARAGAGVNYESGRLNCYFNGEAKYLLSSQYPEIRSKFEYTGAAFKSRGAEEGKTGLGASAGASFKIADPVKIFANTDFFAAEKYNNFYANVGIRYNFCTMGAKKEKPNTDPDGFTYAPPPEFADYSPISSRKQKYEVPAAAETDKKLSDDFFDSLINGINNNGISDEMKTALSNDTKQRASIINLELRKPADTAENDPGEKSHPSSKTYTLSMSNFVPNKAALNDKAKKDLAFIAKEIMMTNYKQIKIEGHTDSTGSDAVNDKLSKDRAKAVYDVLVENGIPSGQISYAGMSSKMPVAANTTAEGRAKNRRVEIVIE